MTTAYLRKYFIMGSQDCSRDPEVILQEAIDAGITVFQYREKGENALQGIAKITLGKKLRKICLDNEVPFIINNDVDLIETLKVDGVHVGQNDYSVQAIRAKYPNLIIGLSVSNRNELEKSQLDYVDYIGAGAIFTTRSKADARQAVGLEWIQQLRKIQPTLPIVGLGGVTTENAKDVIQSGADGVAVISAITKATNIKQVVLKL